MNIALANLTLFLAKAEPAYTPAAVIRAFAAGVNGGPRVNRLTLPKKMGKKL